MNERQDTPVTIRHAAPSDLPAVMALIEGARRFMRQTGNKTQWADGYPSLEVMENDLAGENLYVAQVGDSVEGAFTLVLGEDPYYREIEGAWLDDAPYGTIHRIVSSGRVPRLADRCIDFCFRVINNLRIDTHADNTPMLHVIERNRFSYCGIVHVCDGTPRRAFQASRP